MRCKIRNAYSLAGTTGIRRRRSLDEGEKGILRLVIFVKIVSTPEALIRLRSQGPRIVEALTRKMNELMIRLQSKVIGESIPTFFKAAPNIASTVQMVPAHLEGRLLTGSVQAGGPRTTKITLKSGKEVDYAAVQEYGVDHGWEILPFNKQALRFFIDGKQFIRRRVWHPPLTARPFMRSELQNMEGEIVAGLETAFRESLE